MEKELFVCQEYLLCSLNEKGKVPALSMEIPVCLLAGGLLELISSGCAAIDENKKLIVTGELKPNYDHLRALYDFIATSKPIRVADFGVSVPSKLFKQLISDVSHALVKSNRVTLDKGGMRNKTELFIPVKEQVDEVVKRIRYELLENNAMSEATVALVSLLQEGKQIKNFFSKYEGDQLKQRLKELKDDPSHQLVKEIMDTLFLLLTVVTVIIPASTASH